MVAQGRIAGMPNCSSGPYQHIKRTWRTMERWQRKDWHRANARRVSHGLPALVKP
jgi:hypothetical protein